jgi:hypothetical protein
LEKAASVGHEDMVRRKPIGLCSAFHDIHES